MTEVVKVCDIHGSLTEHQAIKRINYKPFGAPFYWKCHQCQLNANKAQYQKHRAKKIEYAKNYAKEHAAQTADKKKEYRQLNKEKRAAHKREWNIKNKSRVSEYNKRQAEALSDGYIRSLLTKMNPALSNKDLHIPALIEIKRVTVILKRNLREKNSE